MNKGELISRADANYFDCMRTMSAQMDGGEVRERGGLLIAATGLRVAMLNNAFVTRALADAPSLLGQAIEYFDSRSLPFLIRVRESVDEQSELAAEAIGLQHRDSVPGMVLYPLPDALPERLPLEIRRVDDMDSFVQYAETLAAGFGMPPKLGRAFAAPGLLALPGAEFYTAFVDGAPVATSALFMSNRVAGVYNVATLDGYRRRGIGEAITWHAVQQGMKADCQMGALQASEMGRPVYERMGFRVVCHYKTYIRPESLG
jgi:N-acetylglutamate synthase